MAGHGDWMPPSRQEQIDMLKAWLNVLGEDTKDSTGQTVKKWKAWGVSEERLTNLSNVYADSLEIFEKAKSSERTEGITVECEAKFKVMKACMREFKRKSFFPDIMSAEDWVNLKFKSLDNTHTVYGEADAIYSIAIVKRDLMLLVARYAMIQGNPKNPANLIKTVWFKIVGPGEAAPASQYDLDDFIITKRAQDKFHFKPGESGKTVYMAVKSGQDKSHGQWGPMISAVIP